jgi:hypothetical protein
VVGLKFETGLGDIILDDVGHEPGRLPLLEDALLQMWEQRREDQIITLLAYRDSGSVQGALAKRADTIFLEFSPEQQAVTRRLMLRLTQPGEGPEDTRRRAAMIELWTRPEEQWAIEQVVQQLTSARLLTTSVDASGQRQVDVAHEALIRGWPRLRRWIEEDRTALRTHRRITEAAQEWQRMQRDESVLFRGARLAQAHEWRAQHEDDINDLERAFLDTSMALHEREEAEQLARQRRELAQAKALAEEQQQRAETERQRAEAQVKYAKTLKRRNRLIIGAGIVAIVLALLAVRFAILSDARRLAATARGLLNENPQLAVLLALTSEEMASTDEANEVISKALDVYPPLAVTLSKHTDRVTSVAWSPDGAQLASGAWDKTIILWDLARGQPRTTLRGHTDGGTSVRWGLKSQEGERLDEVQHMVVDLLLRGLYSEFYRVTSVAWSPDGAQLASVADDHTIILWDLARSQPRTTLRGHTNVVTSVAWSPDGAQLASGAEDRTVILWDLARGQPRTTLRGHTRGVISVAWSPDGAQLASGSGDWSVHLLAARFTAHPCQWVSRNLSNEEWAEYLPRYWPFHATCPK